MRYIVMGSIVANAQVIVEADNPDEAYARAVVGLWEELEVIGSPAGFTPDSQDGDEFPAVKPEGED